MTMTLTYTWMSARSTFRNTRFVVFTVLLPVVLFLLFNSLFGGQQEGGMSVASYLMVSMACYGGIGAAINAGARIAIERQTGWNRQLRLTALPPQGYMAARAMVAMLVALPAIILVFIVGSLTTDLHTSVGTLVGCALAAWLGLIPFAVMGLVIGFLGTVDSAQPITMLVYLVLAILGGLWFPVSTFPSFMQHLAKALPSYWVAEIARSPLAGQAISMTGVAVLAAWTVGLGALGAWAYTRSGKKV